MFSLIAALIFSVSFLNGVNALVGEGTWYIPGMGACGKQSTENDMIAAIAFGTFDTYPGATANPNNNPICGKKIRATWQGKSVEVAIVDRCADCMNPNNIDFSPAAFRMLADQSVGRLFGLEWEWIDGGAGNPSPGAPPAAGARRNEPDVPDAQLRSRSADATDNVPGLVEKRTVLSHRRRMLKRRAPSQVSDPASHAVPRSINDVRHRSVTESPKLPITPDRRRAMERRNTEKVKVVKVKPALSVRDDSSRKEPKEEPAMPGTRRRSSRGTQIASEV